MSIQIDETELKKLDLALQLYETHIDRNPKNYEKVINAVIRELSKIICKRDRSHNYIVIGTIIFDDDKNKKLSNALFCEILQNILNEKFSSYLWLVEMVEKEHYSHETNTNHTNDIKISWRLQKPPPYSK